MVYYKIDKQIGMQSKLPKGAIEITKEEYEIILSRFKAHRELLDEYFVKVKNGEIELEDIPNDDDRAEIENRMSLEPSNPYGIEDELYDSIIDDYTMMLIEEGVIE